MYEYSIICAQIIPLLCKYMNTFKSAQFLLDRVNNWLFNNYTNSDFLILLIESE